METAQLKDAMADNAIGEEQASTLYVQRADMAGLKVQTLRRLYVLAQAHHRNCATSQSLSLCSSWVSCCFAPRRRSSTPTIRPNL